MRFILILLSIIVLSCSEKKTENVPADLIDKNRFIKILTELHITQGVVNVQTVNDSAMYSVNDYFPAILKRNNADKENFFKTLRWYSEHPVQLKEVYDQVIINLSKMQGAVK